MPTASVSSATRARPSPALEVEITKVTDIGAIADAGVMRTPALGIDATLLFQGRVPTVDELTTLLADVFSWTEDTG